MYCRNCGSPVGARAISCPGCGRIIAANAGTGRISPKITQTGFIVVTRRRSRAMPDTVAKIYIDGSYSGYVGDGEAHDFELLAGRHEVVVRMGEDVIGTATVTIRPSETADVRFVLSRTGAAAFDSVRVRRRAKTPRRHAEKRRGRRGGLVWLALLVLVVGVLAFGRQRRAEPPARDELEAAAETVDYRALRRTPDDYAGRYVTVQVVLRGKARTGLFHMEQCWLGYASDGADVYALLDRRADGARFLEDDSITVYGRFLGLRSFPDETLPAAELPVIEVICADIA